MPRVVLDTNVWVSAFIAPGGVCDELVQALVVRGAQLITSTVLLRELERVLRQKFGASEQGVQNALSLVDSTCELVEPTERVRVVKGKDDDNRVLECALAARADAIISGDTRHLLPLGTFQGIPILSPRIALDQWRQPQS